MPADKLRFRFAKTGLLRLLSHHDLMRCFERMLRRAALPYRRTEGFHPKPRMVFALALPLGIVGHNEVVEIEFAEPVDPEQTRQQLNEQAPAGLTITAVRAIPRAATARPRRAEYRLTFANDLPLECSERLRPLLDSPIIRVDRLHPTPKRTNIRPYIRSLRWEPPRWFHADVWITPFGTVRPEELIQLLLPDAATRPNVLVERTHLELWDEIDPAATADQPPQQPPETWPLPPECIAKLQQQSQHASQVYHAMELPSAVLE